MNILRKTLILGATAASLIGCTSNYIIKDIFQTAESGYVAQLSRKDETMTFPVVDYAHYKGEEIVHYVKFKKEQKASYYKLSGEFAGKSITAAEYYSDTSVRLYVSGASTTSSTGVVFGTLTIDQAAYEVIDEEIKGATIMCTIALGDEAGQTTK